MSSSLSSSKQTPSWMLSVNTESSLDLERDFADNVSPLKRSDSFTSSFRSDITESSFKTKYEPLHSVHQDVQDTFLRPHRKLYSRGHEVPEPYFQGSAMHCRANVHNNRAVSRGSSRFERSSRNNSNVQARPHTSGTSLPNSFSPIRPTERSKNLFSRGSTPLMLRHGHVISQDIFGKDYPYPLNNISYEKPSIMCHALKNAAVPDGADSILEDSRFSSIAPFIKKEFYDSMSSNQMKELAEKRKRKRIVTKKFPNVPAMMSIDYEKRGSPGAVKRQVHRQLFA